MNFVSIKTKTRIVIIQGIDLYFPFTSILVFAIFFVRIKNILKKLIWYKFNFRRGALFHSNIS